MFDKIETLKLKSWCTDINILVEEFRAELRKHFVVVESKARTLINNRWVDDNG